MSSGNWMMGQVVFAKTQSTETASQNAFHSAQAFHGGVGTVVLSRFPGTLIAPPIQMICSIFDVRSGDCRSRFITGVKGQVTSSVTLPGTFSISDWNSASPSGKGGQFGFGGKLVGQLMGDSPPAALRHPHGNGLQPRAHLNPLGTAVRSISVMMLQGGCIAAA